MPFLTTPGARRRADVGRSIRERVARESHAAYEPGPTRPDPVKILNDVAKKRLPSLIPVRDERMEDTPFTFFRGAAAIMASDLAATPRTGIGVQACGDAHCLNFGGFASAERNLIFDVNDFDESLPGPWEWDVKRLVTSIIIAGRANHFRPRASRAAALATAAAYRERIRELAALPAIEVWYKHLDATVIVNDSKHDASRKHRDMVREHLANADRLALVDRLTTGTGLERRFIDAPPGMYHSELTHHSGFDVAKLFAAYPATLAPEVRHLLGRYTLVDYAIKVVGVGSIGTRCAIALFSADDHDPLLLQVKEALPSVLEHYVGPSEFKHHGERVVRGQRAMQASGDPFLGWASSGAHDFYVRQFKDLKAAADLAHSDAADVLAYGCSCAQALAGAHARSGDAAAIAGYAGSSTVLDHALVAFAETYADQSEADYERFGKSALASS